MQPYRIFRLDFRGVVRGLASLGQKQQKETCCADEEKQETIASPRKDRTLDCFKEIKSRLKIKEPLAVSAECGQKLPKVIILGAGLTGLSAAYHLLKHGHNNVVILEASERIGGRILTSWMGDTAIELGDDVINGANVVNSVYNLANMEGLAMHKIPENDPVTYITSDTRLISDHFIQELLFKEMLVQAKGAYKKIGLDCSVLDYLALRIQQEMLNFPSHMRYDSERLMFGMINHLKAMMGTELNKVGTQHFALVNEISGGDVRITQGFCALLAHMVRQLPAEWFQFGKEVKSVEWGASQGTPQVVVNCNEDEVFKGNFVIVTLPLGIIKKKVNCMFLPQLPKGKVNAINGLSVGHTNTVYLEYCNPWWIPQELNMRVAWSPREHKQSSSWTKGIGKIQEVPNSKRVIMFTVGGEEAISMESFSEVEIAVEFTNFLRNLIGDNTIPFPNNIALYRWSCNPYFLGSTVYMPTGSCKGMIKDFFSADCQEIEGTMPILFAGKAAHDRYFGTIHGARMSAIREAERILKLIKVLKQRETCTLEIAEDKEEVCACHS